MNKETYLLLEQQNWPKLIKGLTAFALYYSNHYTYHKRSSNGGLANGYTHIDIVMSSIESIYTGERNWNPRLIDLEKLLMGIIRSKLSNLSESKENQLLKDIEMNNDEDFFWETISDSDGLYTELESKDLINLIRGNLSDDEELGVLFELAIQESKNKEIAAYLSIDIKEVENLKKKLKRRISKYLLLLEGV